MIQLRIPTVAFITIAFLFFLDSSFVIYLPFKKFNEL